MSLDPQRQDGGPILPDTPLARALGGGAVPRLSTDFADRVIAAAEARPAPLPPLRRRGAGWRTGRRFALSFAGVVALASAAAATGLLHQIAPSLPTARTMWASLTAPARAAPAAKNDPAAQAPARAETPTPVGIAGPIDTPEELGEAFRRADQLRANRREVRREVLERRIADALARREAQGLPDLTPAQMAALRSRIAEQEARRQQAIDARVAARRAELERRVGNGEALTPADLARPLRPRPPLAPGSERLEHLRSLSPAERREAVRALPPAERAALVQELRARRAAALAPPAEPAPSPAPAPTPAD
ncbi:MAG: hypothetical protein ACKO01_13670 [Erythrobacter sp.]